MSDTPLSPEWFEAVGFEPDDSDLARYVIESQPGDGDFAGCEIGFLLYHENVWVFECRNRDEPWHTAVGVRREFTTCREVRRLMDAFDIPLKEPSA
jgi:hypothetical protein